MLELRGWSHHIWYTWDITDKKMTKEEIKALQAEIEEYEKKLVGVHERRVRIDGYFEDTVKKMLKLHRLAIKG
jgi:hypothetical protein